LELITLKAILLGFKNLGVHFNENEVKSLLVPFLEAFRKHSITVVDSEEYEFFKIMPVFFMLSKATSIEKAIVVFLFILEHFQIFR
jgi:hypothetical protein